MPEQKRSTKTYLLMGLAVLLALALAVAAVPLIQAMMDPKIQQWLQDWVASLGVWGVLGLFLVQVLQVVVAFIPGEPVELVTGTMYGAAGGLVICLAGILAGSAAIFSIVRRLGRRRLQQNGRIKTHLANYKFLQNERKLESLIFLLYLIPGTPKDMLVYVCALTNITLGRFLLLSTLARIPSIVTSTWAGAAFVSGNWGLTLGIFAVTGLLGLCGIAFQDRFLRDKNAAPGDKPHPEEGP